ncbi:hypothetical protein SAMN05421731_10564 [Acinetobacter puyangensis]|uniref:DUF2474 domain-containing protein n=1 Tax=Acinetobacter puyangensis TaxID=1096779 RepID=A0A240EC69_9GAMM|nr:hypothetical protein SAMN05421731_10564 [Acinetobacter puyangensis]
MKKFKLELTSTQWFIMLWFVGFFGLAVIAGLFKLLLLFAY